MVGSVLHTTAGLEGTNRLTEAQKPRGVPKTGTLHFFTLAKIKSWNPRSIKTAFRL